MNVWHRLKNRVVQWTQPTEPSPLSATEDEDNNPLSQARLSLRALLEDQRVPESVRETLADDFQQIEVMLDKLEQGHLHIAVFGRVSVGKSALLNALLGKQHFSTSPLHGETRHAQLAQLEEYDAGGLFLIDTPGINEVDGESRGRLAKEVASRADLILFVCDGDLTQTEIETLEELKNSQRPILLVLNKADRYTSQELSILRSTLLKHTKGLIPEGHFVTASAQPPERIYLQVDAAGNETEFRKQAIPDIALLRERLWTIMESEGSTLAALNAGLAASDLAEQVGLRIIKVQQGVSEKLIRAYCVSKGVLVAANPVPATDLFAAIAVDVAMISHLSRLYESPLTRSEAGTLIRTIAAQMALLMGTVWGVHLLSSALKTSSFGLSTMLTASAQGGVAYYSCYVVGQAANQYFAQGRSWGEKGPKKMVQEILNSIDRDSILMEAKEEIRLRLKAIKTLT